MTAIVILGAAVWADGPSPTLRRRTDHAATMFHEKRGDRILACGGTGHHPPSEAHVMQDLLLAQGIPKPAIYREDQSTTTYENLRNARAILRADGIRDVLIVTDRYHAPRALMVARALGLKAQVASSAQPEVRLGVRLGRLRHEALAIPGYAIGLIWWLWRDRDQF